MNALVVPTNSSERLAHFLRAWAPWPWDLIVIVHDAPEVAIDIPDDLRDVSPARVETFSWAEIDAMLPDPSIISRRDSAVRSFGFWRAWTAGAQIIYTLDDDCYPAEDDFVVTHRENLYRTPAWASSVPGLRVRGLPYRTPGVLHNVQLSMGLWRGFPDLDAVRTLAGSEPSQALAEVDSRVMPSHQYFPMSGMNLAFRRDIACLMYFAPMGEGQPFARFDDIWCGIVVQRVCRHLGYAIVCGRPVVDHRRASDPFRNLVKEAPGIAANERLWEVIDAIPLSGHAPHDCMLELGVALSAQADAYLAGWGRSIIGWCALFEPVMGVVEARTLAAS